MKNSGFLIVGMFCLYLVSVVSPALVIVPTILAWLVPLSLWSSLSKSSVQQAAVLLSLGTIAIIFSASQGIFLGWKHIFAVNLPVLAMFVAVSFLSLANKETEDSLLPIGKRAVLTTGLGTHLLGGVINLSVLFVFADRMQSKGRLTMAQVIVLSRSFCSAAWWSPFFVATGVALTYAPAMDWKESLMPGIIMSVIALCYTFVEICLVKKSHFSGYPVRVESMVVPLFLATTVLVFHHFWRDVSVMLLITLVSPLGAMVFMKGGARLATIKDFITNKIVSVVSQFALFLAAGVFSTGLKSVILVYPGLFSLVGQSFTPSLFAMVLGGMLLVGIMGVHPIVTIAIVSPLLMPLNPDHSQLGFLFLTSWAVATGSSPLSGVGLAMVSRYQISARWIVLGNWHYALVMWVLASVMNFLFFA